MSRGVDLGVRRWKMGRVGSRVDIVYAWGGECRPDGGFMSW